MLAGFVAEQLPITPPQSNLREGRLAADDSDWAKREHMINLLESNCMRSLNCLFVW